MKRVFVVLLLSLLFPISMFPQNFWQQTAGPGVGSITGFGKGLNGLILAASNNSVFLSTDKGATWQGSSNAFEFHTNEIFAVNSQGWIYSISGDQILVSKNQGKDWSSTSGSPSEAGGFASFRTIAIDPDGVIYVGSENEDSKGVWYSDDEGATWASVKDGLPTLPAIGGLYSVSGMAIAPDGTVYICSGGGVQRLESGGSTWSLAGFGGQSFGGGVTDSNVLDIAVSHSGKVFAVVSSIGLCSSTNKGKSWTKLGGNNGLTTTLGESVATDENVGIVYCAGLDGVFISTDNGNTWKQSRPESNDPAQAAAFVGNAAEAYVGYNSSGVAFSSNKGTTWVPRNKGLFTSHISAMGTDNNDNVYASVQLGSLFVSNTAGDVWTEKGEALAAKDVRGIVSTPTNILFAAAYKTPDETGGVYKSTDGGVNWTDLTENSIIIKGTHREEITTLISSPTGTIFAGGNNGVVYIGTNNGDNWLKSGQPVRDGITQNPITALAWAAQEHLFAANVDGIFRNNDYTNTSIDWDTLLTSPKNVTAMAVDLASNPNIIYAAATDGIYSSNDDGATWNKNGTVTNAIGIAINSKGKIYAIGLNGTYSSVDKGGSWKLESTELNSLSPTLLFVDRKDVLYAGTSANGVYRNLPGEAGVFTSHHSAETISFESNYPNPFFTSTTIGYSLVKPSQVKLDILDMTGKYITTIVDAFQSEGDHSALFDATALSIPGGVYNCRLSSNGESIIKPVVFIGK